MIHLIRRSIRVQHLIIALERETTVLRSMHSSGELKGALRGTTTCADTVGIIDWGGVLFMSLRICHLWGRIITYLPSVRSFSYICCR